MLVASRDRFEHLLPQRKFGAIATQIGESQCHHGLRAMALSSALFPGKSEDQPLRLDDLAIGTAGAVLGALGRTCTTPPLAANPHVHFIAHRSEALRPPPLRGLLR